MIAISKEIERCKRLGLKGVLATIISTKGSTYQKEGAKCFFAEDGGLTGLISGGCVEADIIEHGKKVIETGETKLLSYDLQDNGDDIWGLGVGCNGSMEIFLELYDPDSSNDKAEVIEKMFSPHKKICVSTIIQSNEDSLLGTKSFIALEKINETVDKGLHDQGNNKIFIEMIEPTPKLLLFGSGPDAVPVVEMIKKLDWYVTIVDHRPDFITKEKFPLADKRICSVKGKMPDLILDENTYTLVMSHHFLQDQLAVEYLLESNVPYIGILGPKKRTSLLFKPLTTKKTQNTNRIFNPVGLNIGAQTPEEIALSITAELINVYRKGISEHIRDTKKGFKSIDD